MSPNNISVSHHQSRHSNNPKANAPADCTVTSPLITKPPTPKQSHEHDHDPKEKPHKTHLFRGIEEARSIASIALPMMLTGLLLYSRSMISTLFLAHLGELPLAGGSLAIGFANITGYSILSGLAMGMEPHCSQAFGAKRYKLLELVLQRTILLLLTVSIPISILWLNMKSLLLLSGQDEEIATQAQLFILYSLPDLIAQSFLHPLRIYLRSQSITLPLTYCATLSLLLHIPTNYLLVSHLNLGIKGVALSSAISNFIFILALILYIPRSPLSTDAFREWGPILYLAIPSCISVCLEWWWYEIMILLCGLLANPRSTIASMGILIQTTSLIYIFPSSLSFSVSTRVGNELGANQPHKAKLASIVGLMFSFLIGLVALFFTLEARHAWASMFTRDVEILALTSAVLPIIGVCEMGNCPQTTLCGVLRGTARPRVGANINLVCFYLVGMPVAVWLGFYRGWDFRGLWMGLLAAQAACAVAMVAALARTDWESEAKRARELTGGCAAEGVCETLVESDLSA